MRLRNVIIPIAALACAAGAAAIWLSPDARIAVAAAIKAAQGSPSKKVDQQGHAHVHGPGEKTAPEGFVKLSDEQIAKAKIDVAPAGKGTIARRLTVPGTVSLDSDRIGRVAAKVIGTVADLRKRLGDPVAKGEIVAVLDSREVADAKSDYLAATVTFELQKTLFEREQLLFERKISPEQQFIRARSAFTEARLRVDVARQKLSALDLTEADVANLSMQRMETLRHKELRAPISGQVVERRVDLGAPVGGEGQEKEVYVIADLSWLWVEMSVPLADLPAIKVGQPVWVATASEGSRTEGRIVFISPMLNAETRSARVIASIDNKAMMWRPGSYVTAQITLEEQESELVVPREAVQSIAGEQVLFVRTETGFEKREVVTGRADETHVEIVFGLDAGELIAVANTFILKAELGKSEAEHDHAH
jgi:cobalt-zinc-cadmium efflux system membrane fusion protein